MMKQIMTIAALGVLAGCMAPGPDAMSKAPRGAAEAEAGAITSEAAFRSAIVGRELTFKANRFTINADGTFSGPWDGNGISGTWVWEDGAFCREGVAGARVLDRDCQTWAVNGATATVTRDRGAGPSFDYTIG
ncbi:MAG: hypothetical protein AAF092_06680 [Pseudomonadota bacterium]